MSRQVHTSGDWDTDESMRHAHREHHLSEAIVETVREPLILLTADYVVQRANRAFYKTFGLSPAEVENVSIFQVGGSEWNIPTLRDLLERIIPQNTTIEDFEVSHDFRSLGHRVMLLNARKLENNGPAILLALEDITERKKALVQLTQLNKRLRISLAESNHRVKNTLNLISLQLQVILARNNGTEPQALRDLIAQLGLYADLHDIITIQGAVDDASADRISLKMVLEKLLAFINLAAPNSSLSWKIDERLVSKEKCSTIALIINEAVTNSLKYGGSEIRVAVTNAGDGLNIEVWDSGSGAPSLFESKGGRGSGLALLRELARADLDSDVELIDLQGGGTAVRVQCVVC